MRNTFINRIIEACDYREDIFIIAGDAGFGVFDDFQKRFPHRFLNMGVAEQNMASFSAGLTMAGFRVCMYNIIPFLLYRCYEQVRNDICYQRLPVIMAGIGSGVTYAPMGMTHYSVEDIGIARTLPNLTILSPIDPVEARLAAQYALMAEGPVYVRLAKRGEPVIHEKKNFDITMPQILRKGRDVAILFHGSISVEVMKAHAALLSEGIEPMVVSIPCLQPLNKEALVDILKDIQFVVSVEEHYENSGLGNILSDIHKDLSPQWQLKTMGLRYRFIHEIENTEGMRISHGISSSSIVKTIKDILEVGYGTVIEYCNTTP